MPSHRERFGLTMGVRPGRGAIGRQSAGQRDLRDSSAATGRLQGLSEATSQATSLIRRDFTSQGQLALRQGGQVVDPQEDLAREYRLAGRRIADPYAAAAIREIEQARAFRTLHAGETVDLWPDGAPFPPQSVAGWRTTQFGGAGMNTGNDLRDPHGRLWSARGRAGAMEFGSRDGTMTELDIAEKNRFMSGILQAGSMTCSVTPERPYLMLRCPPTSADSALLVRVTAGAPGGAESQRTFFLGGGFTVNFMLDGYQSVKIEILDRQRATDIMHWAWEITGVQAGDQSLYFVQTVAASVFLPVPEGAFQVSVAVNCALWSWRTGTGGLGAMLLDNQNLLVIDNPHPVLGVEFNTGNINAVRTVVCWALRPI
jgi:hypothetical protein